MGVEAGDDLSPNALLASIKTARATEDAAAARQLTLAAQWADLHPPESIHSAAAFTVRGCEHEEPIAGQGCPLVAEFCVAELGTVLGISTSSAKKLIGHALELRHRLPRLWTQVQSGRVPAWRGRLVAETTIHSAPSLTPEAAGWVDSQVAAVAGKIGPTQLDRLVAETIKRFDLAQPDPASDPEDGYLAVDPRHVTVNKDDVHYAGTLHVEAELDIADALDLDRALAHSAATQKALGSDLSLNARRATALGDLARTQTALDLFTQGHTGAKDHDGLPLAREVVLHAHFTAGANGESTVFGPTGRLEEGQLLIVLDQVKDWCADTRTKITIKPVIDLNAHLEASGHAIPDRIRERIILRTAPASSRGAPARRGVATSTTWSSTTITPTQKTDPNQGRRRPRISVRCVGSTTASRPTHLGTTTWSNPGCSSGPAPTATTTDVTETAPPRSTHPTRLHHGSPASADHDPAPHPATPRMAGPQARRVCAAFRTL